MSLEEKLRRERERTESLSQLNDAIIMISLRDATKLIIINNHIKIN